jgi:hypothetical protein
MSMGGRADRQECEDGERGPPSARAEILVIFSLMVDILIIQSGLLINYSDILII